MSITVTLERFEGPLGLLLHLIRSQEMDIFNINVHEITKQYLEYIKAMRRLDLEVAGEFVAMAATLLHIKSKMLLPQYNEEGELVESEDPRKELVQRLVEYQMFQDASKQLYQRSLLGRDVFARGERADIEPEVEGELIVEENPLFSLISSYRQAIKAMKRTVHRVVGELQSISSRIMEIRERLVIGHRVRMQELITEDGITTNRSSQVLVTFLSLLELAKMGFISLFQTDSFSDIHIDPKKVIDHDIVSQVEDYSVVNAEAKADELMHNAQMSLIEADVNAEDDDIPGVPAISAAPVEAATDEEIMAEEQRLFADEENPNV